MFIIHILPVHLNLVATNDCEEKKAQHSKFSIKCQVKKNHWMPFYMTSLCIKV